MPDTKREIEIWYGGAYWMLQTVSPFLNRNIVLSLQEQLAEAQRLEQKIQAASITGETLHGSEVTD